MKKEKIWIVKVFPENNAMNTGYFEFDNLKEAKESYKENNNGYDRAKLYIATEVDV